MMHTILKYLPYVLLFAVATMIVYGWGLWRTMRQGSDLANMLSSKGISKVKKTLKKNGPMTRTALEPYVKDLTAKQPFMQEQINVTDPRQFLDSILPYMVKQKMITEEKVNGKIVYQQGLKTKRISARSNDYSDRYPFCLFIFFHFFFLFTPIYTDLSHFSLTRPAAWDTIIYGKNNTTTSFR